MKKGLVFLACAAVAVGSVGAVVAQPRVGVRADMSQGVLQADKKQTTFLRVQLRGFQVEAAKRARLNVAIVIDKSSSMSGSKIQQAKAAALEALNQLGGDDIVSVVAYDSTVSVLVPATKVRDRRTIRRGIQKLRAGGMTALFGGTSKGADEVRKFIEDERVNRVVLLSDGQANVGPRSPGQLGALGRSLRRQGISVTTVGLGLGYNEDIMVALAQRSGGQHVFVEHDSQLAKIFREGFGSLTRICAKDVKVELTIADGFRPVRVLGPDADIVGQNIHAKLAALYAMETDELIVELEAAPSQSSTRPVADVSVSYLHLGTQKVTEGAAQASVRFSDRRADVEASVNKRVMVSVVELVANEQNELAVRLRDEGRVEQAQKILRGNSVYLQKNYQQFKDEKLKRLGIDNDDDAENLDDRNWNKRRKQMKSRSYKSKLKSGSF